MFPRLPSARIVASKFSLGTRIRSVPGRDLSPCDCEEDSTNPWNVPATEVACWNCPGKSPFGTWTESCAVFTISGPTEGTELVSIAPPPARAASEPTRAGTPGGTVTPLGPETATPSVVLPALPELVDEDSEPNPPPVTKYPMP